MIFLNNYFLTYRYILWRSEKLLSKQNLSEVVRMCLAQLGYDGSRLLLLVYYRLNRFSILNSISVVLSLKYIFHPNPNPNPKFLGNTFTSVKHSVSNLSSS